MMRLFLVLGLVAAVVLVVAPLLAQDEGEEGQQRPQRQSWLSLIFQGSKFMGIGFIIMGLSIVSIALIVEHFMTVKRDALVPPELVAHLEQLLDEGDFENAKTMCESAPNFLTNVILAGLVKLEQERPFEEVEAAMQEAGDQEAVKLHQKISYLSLLGQVSPMLGLFGTVAGMIAAFAEIARSTTSPEPRKLAWYYDRAGHDFPWSVRGDSVHHRILLLPQPRYPHYYGGWNDCGGVDGQVPSAGGDRHLII